MNENEKYTTSSEDEKTADVNVSVDSSDTNNEYVVNDNVETDSSENVVSISNDVKTDNSVTVEGEVSAENTVNETTQTTKKKSWIEVVIRSIYTVLGAIACFFGLDGYYSNQVNTTKENVGKVNEYIVTAIEQMKTGEYVDAIETLTNAKNTIIEIKEDVTDTIKETKASIEKIKDDYANLKVAIELKDKESIKEYALMITEKMIETTPYDKLNDDQKKIYDSAKFILDKLNDENLNTDNVLDDKNILDNIESLDEEMNSAE